MGASSWRKHKGPGSAYAISCVHYGQNLMCGTPGCRAVLSDTYTKRHKVCHQHLKALAVTVDEKPCRFCQCGRFHEVSAFSGDRRSCDVSLLTHNARRRTVKKEGQDFSWTISRGSKLRRPQIRLPAKDNQPQQPSCARTSPQSATADRCTGTCVGELYRADRQEQHALSAACRRLAVAASYADSPCRSVPAVLQQPNTSLMWEAPSHSSSSTSSMAAGSNWAAAGAAGSNWAAAGAAGSNWAAAVAVPPALSISGLAGATSAGQQELLQAALCQHGRGLDQEAASPWGPPGLATSLQAQAQPLVQHVPLQPVCPLAPPAVLRPDYGSAAECFPLTEQQQLSEPVLLLQDHQQQLQPRSQGLQHAGRALWQGALPCSLPEPQLQSQTSCPSRHLLGGVEGALQQGHCLGQSCAAWLEPSAADSRCAALTLSGHGVSCPVVPLASSCSTVSVDAALLQPWDAAAAAAAAAATVPASLLQPGTTAQLAAAPPAAAAAGCYHQVPAAAAAPPPQTAAGALLPTESMPGLESQQPSSMQPAGAGSQFVGPPSLEQLNTLLESVGPAISSQDADTVLDQVVDLLLSQCSYQAVQQLPMYYTGGC